MKHSSSGGDKFKWSWKRGAATTLGEFGDPTADTDYVLCMYSIESAQTRLIVEQHMDTDGLCRFEDCWQPQSSGYAYGDGAGISGAIRRISLVPGDDGRASISAQGSGPSLGFPLLPVFGLTQMHLQLVKWRDGSCWESVLDEIQSNTDKSLSLIGH